MASTSHTEKTHFAKSTPIVIVLTETSPSADGCFATPSWPSRPLDAGSLFLLIRADGYAATQLRPESPRRGECTFRQVSQPSRPISSWPTQNALSSSWL